MQIDQLNPTFRSVIAKTLRHEGFFGFYKGMGPPMVFVPFINSIIFSSYEFCKRFIGVTDEKDFTFS